MNKNFIALMIAALLMTSAAQAETVSSVTIGMNYYKGSDGTSAAKVANPGYGIQFLTGEAGKWLRTAYGASIEMASGTPAAGAASLLAGNLIFGVELAPKNAQRLSPFVGIFLDTGWANYTVTDASNNNGLLFGGQIGGGAEIKLKSGGSSSLALRIQTAYRMLAGTIGGGLSGADLSAVTFGVGLVF